MKRGEKIIEHNNIEEMMAEPMIRLRYQYAMNVVQARLELVNASLSKESSRQVIRNLSSRIKTADSILKKLIRKERKPNFETAEATLNDIAGVRVVCYFCDDIYRVADAVKAQKDFTIIKEKDYVKCPKKSGYQSLHLIVGVPVTYNGTTKEVRVEIQIRSFAMDYWAELDNQMCYKKSAGEIENVEREIRNYSDVIAKVDNKMLELRQRIEKMN